MAIEFNCHVCGKLLRTSEAKSGKTAKCPGCGESLSVPQAEVGPDDYDSDESGGSGLDEFDDAAAPSTQSGATKACPMCGEQIRRAARRCRFCGEDLADRYSSRSTSYSQPHRGAMLLTFGILGFVVCPIFAIVAWVMANGDLQEMKAGRMDPEGEGLTKAGKIISIVSLSLTAAGLLLYCFFVIMFVAVGAA
jgi:predicted RNA-binding Zn-ribbon protein involved in translation (DUF1610 family)